MIRQATTAADLAAARELLREYPAWLAERARTAGVDLAVEHLPDEVLELRGRGQ